MNDNTLVAIILIGLMVLLSLYFVDKYLEMKLELFLIMFSLLIAIGVSVEILDDYYYTIIVLLLGVLIYRNMNKR